MAHRIHAEKARRRTPWRERADRQAERHGDGERGDCYRVDEQVDGIAHDDSVVEARELEHREELPIDNQELVRREGRRQRRSALAQQIDDALH